MEILLGFIVPLIIIGLPITFQIMFTSKRLKHKTNIPLFLTFIISLVVGFITPVIAFGIGTNALTANSQEEGQCLTGFVPFLLLGYLIDVGGCVIIAIIGVVLYKPLKEDLQTDS